MSIHPTAIIDKSAIIENNVSIGPFSIVYSNVVIKKDTKIESYCQIGYPSSNTNISESLVVENNSLIRSNSIIYSSSLLGSYLVTGHNVVIRENTIVGRNVQIGTNSEIQGDCSIGNYVKFQSGVFVGKNTIIKDFVWILSNVILTNDPTPPSNILTGPTINEYAVICAGSIILPGINIGMGAVVGAMSCVTRDVREGYCVRGNPAVEIKLASEIMRRDILNEPAYPWTKRFIRGYPESITESWNEN